MKKFCFTIDDNIRFLEDLTKNNYSSIFENPYLAMLKRLRDKFNIVVQLNLFYKTDNFDLSMMTDRYKGEFTDNSNWIKFSFHSYFQQPKPYEFSNYQTIYEHCKKTHEQIIRFAGEKSLAKTTTIHYCLLTSEGILALKSCNVYGFLGLYGQKGAERLSYQNTPDEIEILQEGGVVESDGMFYSGIDQVINGVYFSDIEKCLTPYLDREFVKVMIHEQYFYPDYIRYQHDFEDKLRLVFEILTKNYYNSIFFEEILP